MSNTFGINDRIGKFMCICNLTPEIFRLANISKTLMPELERTGSSELICLKSNYFQHNDNVADPNETNVS